jgi:predicted enzyme related to lactoylglutathione lyase
MTPPITRIIIYTKHVDEMVNFYCQHFGFTCAIKEDDRIIELRPARGGAILMLHPTGKGRKMGQTLIKLVFDIEDVETAIKTAAANGLIFGPIHKADGYSFANAKDPSGNSVTLSSRAFAPDI